MEDKVRWSVNAGVLVVRQDGSKHCVTCDRTVPEPELLPHFEGKDHFNNLVWYIIENPSPAQLLLDALPDVVQAAKRSNEVEVVDKASFSFRCLVCPKKLPFNGIKPLESHLKGKDHRKASNTPSSFLYSTNQTPQPQPTLPPQPQPTQPPQPQPTRPPQPRSTIPPQPQPTIPPQPQPTIPPQPQPTPPPQPQPTLPPQPQPTLPPQPQPTLPPQPQPGLPPQPQPTPPPATSHHHYHQPSQPNYNGTHPLQYSPAPQAQRTPAPPNFQPPARTQTQPFTSGGPQQIPSQLFRNKVGALALQLDGSSPDVDSALATGVVVSTGTTSFHCRACNIDTTGPVSMQQHLRSDKHKKKAPLHQVFSSLSIDGNPRTPPRAADSMVIVRDREDQVDASSTFPWLVVPSRSYQQPSKTVYCNLSMPRGLVLIFNYYHTGSRNERLGAKRDSFNVKTLFNRMGYHVYLYEDLSKAQTGDKLQIIRDDHALLAKFDSLIVFVMSHGEEDKYFITGDNARMTLDEVRYSFTDTSCPALKDKPKLFFVNFCRGSRQEPHIQFDSLDLQRAAPKDMVTMYACISGYQAPRDPQNGTLFVQVWCEVLAGHAHEKELQNLHRQVCDTVVRRGGATPEIQGYHFKEFYFNPISH